MFLNQFLKRLFYVLCNILSHKDAQHLRQIVWRIMIPRPFLRYRPFLLVQTFPKTVFRGLEMSNDFGM